MNAITVRFFFCIAASVLSVVFSGSAPVQAQEAPPQRLIVGVKEAPPFVMPDGSGGWTGLSVELWRAVAADLGIDYDIKVFDFADLRSAIEEREVDVVVGALSITPRRETFVDFTHTFFVSSLGIAVPADGDGSSGILSFLTSSLFLRMIGGLALLLTACGVLLWWLERKRNPEHFEDKRLPGIGSGIWWAAVTMTTVGYGDKVPKSLAGRATALVWMFTSLVLVSVFTGTVASILTVQGLDTKVKGPEDLPRARVASVAQTAAGLWLTEERIRFVSYPTVEEAIDALAAGRADAVVYDRPILSYLAHHRRDGTVAVLPRKFALNHYGFALPPGSPLREPVNQAILSHIQAPEWHDTVYRFIGTAP